MRYKSASAVRLSAFDPKCDGRFLQAMNSCNRHPKAECLRLYHLRYNLVTENKEKLVIWIGSSKKDLMALPIEVRKFFGHALDFAQRGGQHDAAKVLKGFGGAGILEVVEDDVGGTFRAVYTVKFEEAVFVLHCFQKKSKSGIATPKEHMDIIHARLKVAEAFAKELRNEKANR